MTCETDRVLALVDEYNDLEEEYCTCDDHDERLRCWHRMKEIAEALDGSSGSQRDSRAAA